MAVEQMGRQACAGLIDHVRTDIDGGLVPRQRPYQADPGAGATIAEMAVEETVSYCKQRGAFGKTVFDFQNTRFKLAECKTEATVSRTFVDQCISKHICGDLTAEEASMAKWWCSQKQCDIVDECLQLHGGYGYMWEYPIARMYADSRVQKIYGGTNEIMKELIARSL